MPTITKYGDDFYALERLHCSGHRDKDGRILAGPGALVFAFQREDDPPHMNVNPADVLEVLHEHLMGTPAGAHIANAMAALADDRSAAAPDERSAGVTPAGGATSEKRSHKKKSQPAAA
jgi:hypothetical protein